MKKHASPPPPNDAKPDRPGHCYSKHWNWVRLSHDHTPIHVDPHAHYKLKKFANGSNKFDIIRFQDCSIAFRSHENFKYVSNNSQAHYELRADGYYIGDEDKYRVYRYPDGNYAFKSMKHHSWVFVDHQGNVKSTPHAHTNDHQRKFHITSNP